VALMQSCFEACLKPTGRPRKYQNRTERSKATSIVHPPFGMALHALMARFKMATVNKV